jgi:CheY-like chemotaxis protein
MRTVLIADSDAFQRQLIDMLLAVDNHRVLGFESGRSLLEYLQAHAPDLVILDYNLPDINGADLCAKMKKVKRLAHVPVILVTAAHKLELVKGIATAVRADLVLAKPLGDKHLREQVLELLTSPSKTAFTKPYLETSVTSTAIQIDPVLEQALANLTHESLKTSATTSYDPKNYDSKNYDPKKPSEFYRPDTFNAALTPVPIDRDEEAPYTLELPTPQHHIQKPQVDDLPLLFHDAPAAVPEEPLHEIHSDTFQHHANAALESLLGPSKPGASLPDVTPPDITLPAQREDTAAGLFEFFDDELRQGNGISEQELLDSLQTPLETQAILGSPMPERLTPETSLPEQPELNPPPFTSEATATYAELGSLEAQPYTLGGSASAAATFASSFEETVSDIEAELTTYRAQVQQLAAENERLRATLLELETGTPLATSKSYLDMVEELEMLRRLTDIQVKQMDGLQRQNQRLMEDAQQSQERRRGLFGFLQNKNQS